MQFSQAQAEAIAGALGDTNAGLTGSEIGHLLTVCGMPDPDPSSSKRVRLLAAFAASQNARRDSSLFGPISTGRLRSRASLAARLGY